MSIAAVLVVVLLGYFVRVSDLRTQTLRNCQASNASRTAMRDLRERELEILENAGMSPQVITMRRALLEQFFSDPDLLGQRDCEAELAE